MGVDEEPTRRGACVVPACRVGHGCHCGTNIRGYTAVVRLGIRNIIFNINPRIPRRGPAPAFRTHVNNSGNILTAWRILRCIPRFFLFPLLSFFLQSLSPPSLSLSFSLLLVFCTILFAGLSYERRYRAIVACRYPRALYSGLLRSISVGADCSRAAPSTTVTGHHGSWEFHLSIKYLNLPSTAQSAR